MSDSKSNPFARHTAVTLPLIVRDLYGRELAKGDRLMLPSPTPILYFVESITPVVDPNLPSNLMEIIVTARFKFHAVRNDSNNEFIRVVAASEIPPTPSKEGIQ